MPEAEGMGTMLVLYNLYRRGGVPWPHAAAAHRTAFAVGDEPAGRELSFSHGGHRQGKQRCDGLARAAEAGTGCV
jgi:hypothetical protein